MNSLVGKSTGIALLMAAALLAALFAMGVFSATGVGAHPAAPDADPVVTAHDNLNSIAMTVNDDPDDDDDATRDDVLPGAAADGSDHEFEIAIPVHATDLQVTVAGGSSNGDATDWGAVDSFAITATVDGSNVEVTETATVTGTSAMGTFSVPLADGIVTEIKISANDAPASGADTSPASVYTVTLTYAGAANTSNTGGGGTAIAMTYAADDEIDLQRNQNIVIKLPDFTVPDEIDTEDITVNSAHPSDVGVSGTTLTLRMGFTGEDATSAPADAADITSIFISKRAGIKNPPQANDAPDSYPITVEDGDAVEDDEAVRYAVVLRKVSAKPDKGIRGTVTTISGSGLPEGSTTLTINGDDRDTEHNISVTVSEDGTFEHEIATNAKDNDDKNVFSKGANNMNVSDAQGKKANVTGTFTINGSFTIAPESPIPGELVTITLSDIEGAVTDASFAGKGIEDAFDLDDAVDGVDAPVKTVDKDDGEYQIKMPSGVRRGSLEMRVIVGTGADAETLKKTITIATNSLSVDPETVVPGQQITITGSGFTKNGSIDAENIKIDSKVVASADETIDSTGNINITVNLVEIADEPRTIKSGSRNVEITDSSGRVGTAKITVTKATITLDPAEGLVGSTMTVGGAGFPANDLVLIKYAGTTISTANTDPSGNFSKDVTVPSSADVGSTGKVSVESQVIKNVTATEDHKTPAPALSDQTSTTGQAGGTVTVGGINFKGYVRVFSIKIGGTDVTPVPAPSTDQWGAFTATDVQVPNLTLGTHPVEITVDEKSVTGFIQITVAPASTAPADAFESLGDRLVRVWYLDSKTQEWSYYDPNPAFAPFNSLTEVKSGQVVIVITSAGDPTTFQGMTLYQGTNNIALD